MDKQMVELNNRTILVTGSPGFIGAHLVIRLLRELRGGKIISLDSMNDYYDPKLKEYRLSEIETVALTSPVKHLFIRGNLVDRDLVFSIFSQYKPSVVVNLAAYAGVRYSIEHPSAYIESNILGFFNVLEACRHHPVEHLVYASSSSVYGEKERRSFHTEDKTDKPVSLYAATKKSDELLAYSYSKLYDIPSTGLRFFTVYGPAGRPDMFYYSAARRLVGGEPICLFNFGNCLRDYTYISDIVDGILCVMQGAPKQEVGRDGLPLPPYSVYDIGCGHPANLRVFVRTLEEELIQAGLLPDGHNYEENLKLLPMQPGDVTVTCADCGPLERDFGFRPSINIRDGLHCFAEWYRSYHGI